MYYTKMNQSDIDAVYNNMLNLLKQEISISQYIIDKTQLSYRLRNIFTFILEHYDTIINNNRVLVERHMEKYYNYSIDIINIEYNLLSNMHSDKDTKLSADEVKTFGDYKKTIDCVERFRKRYYA
jgi:hypothetical protein